MKIKTEVPNENQRELRKPSLGQMCKPSRCSLLEELRQAEAMIQQLREERARLQAECDRLQEELAHSEGNSRMYREMLFGSNPKRNPSKTQTPKAGTPKESEDEKASQRPPTKPGAKPGHPGKGRKIPNLETEEVIHDIPDDEAVCPVCGKPYSSSGFCEESFEIAMEIRFYLKKHTRKRKFRNCNCEQAPRQLTAAKPANIIPKGLYDHSVISFLLYGKYGMQVSLHRLLGLFSAKGLTVNDSTIAGIFKKLADKLYPLYQILQEQLQEEFVLYIDETGFRHFQYPEATIVSDEQKPSKFTWLWVFSGDKATVFTVEPTRSSIVLEQTLGLDADMFIVSDGAGAYRKFASETEVQQGRCWAHFLRHFKDAATKFPMLQSWSMKWMERIAELFTLNARRLNASDPTILAQAQEALEQHVGSFYQQMLEEKSQPDIHPEAFKVLTSGIKYWEAYTLFVNHPEVAMDNNLAERNLRSGVLGRKNWYGVHAAWSGTLTAMMMSFIQTAQKHNLNPIAYLHYILDTAATWKGKPRNVAKLLPWNIGIDTMQRYSMTTGCDPP